MSPFLESTAHREHRKGQEEIIYILKSKKNKSVFGGKILFICNSIINIKNNNMSFQMHKYIQNKYIKNIHLNTHTYIKKYAYRIRLNTYKCCENFFFFLTDLFSVFNGGSHNQGL